MTHITANLAQITGFTLCAIILIRAEPAINQMGTHAPPHIVRLAFALLATGAVAGMLAIATGKVPDLAHLILTAGIAALLLCKKRIRLLLRIKPTRKGLPHA